MKQRLLIYAAILVLSAACQQAASTPTVEAPRVAAKLLATVYMSPTPNEAEFQATRRVIVPTATPAPPTAIPSPTPYIGVFLGEANENLDSPAVNPALLGVLATPTVPTTAGAGCDTPPDGVFGTTWTQNEDVVRRLGCPIQVMFGFKGNIQVFERGVMYWREDTGEIWAIAPGGTGAGRYWYVAQPPSLSTSEFTAPDGLFVPVRGFGSVWKGVPGVRDALGFAQTGERRVEMAMQRFDSGALFLDNDLDTVFALMVNGDAYGPY